MRLIPKNNTWKTLLAGFLLIICGVWVYIAVARYDRIRIETARAKEQEAIRAQKEALRTQEKEAANKCYILLLKLQALAKRPVSREHYGDRVADNKVEFDLELPKAGSVPLFLFNAMFSFGAAALFWDDRQKWWKSADESIDSAKSYIDKAM